MTVIWTGDHRLELLALPNGWMRVAISCGDERMVIELDEEAIAMLRKRLATP